MDPASRLHRRRRAVAARRNRDHGGAAVGRARPARLELLDGARAERLLCRLRADAVPRGAARRPDRRALGRAPRLGLLRRWRGARGGRVQPHASVSDARAPGRRRGPREPGGACRCRQWLPARAARQRARDLGSERRHGEPRRTIARRHSHCRVRLARRLVGARAAGAGCRLGRRRPRPPARARGRRGRTRPSPERDRRRRCAGRGPDVRRDDRNLLPGGAVPAEDGPLLGARGERGARGRRTAGRRRCTACRHPRRPRR